MRVVCAEGLKWNPRPLLRSLGAMPPRLPRSPEASKVGVCSSFLDIVFDNVQVIRIGLAAYFVGFA